MMRANRKGSCKRLLITFFLIINISIVLSQLKIEGQEIKSEGHEISLVKVRCSASHSKIHITGTNWTDTVIAGICTGGGTYDNPYIIQDWEIDASQLDSCIIIENSNEYFIIENCTLTNSENDPIEKDSGIKLYNVDNGKIRNNTINSNKGNGIYMEASAWNNITDNNINGSSFNQGVRLVNCNNINITENIITNNAINGIVMTTSTHINMIKNLIRGNNFNGINLVENSNYNNIIYNIIDSNSKSGLKISPLILTATHSAFIYNNSFTHNGQDGLSIDSLAYTVIKDNNVSFNGRHGMFFEYSAMAFIRSHNNVSNNFICNNTQKGIAIEDAKNVTFSLNTLRGNVMDAQDNGTDNTWYNKSISMGNEWGEYAGKDVNDDKIGDTPYNVPGTAGKVDLYPIFEDGDDIKPSITIHSPIDNQLFNSTAPSFIVEILDAYLDEMWYSLNGGNNISFTSNHTFDPAEWGSLPNGTIIITFYANDSANNMTYATVMVRKDCLAPSITIIKPTQEEVCGSTAPNFNVIILDAHIDKTWYCLNGMENKTFMTNGTIDPILWSAMEDGIIIIRFHANDTLGNLAWKEVSVTKTTQNGGSTSTIINTILPTSGIASYDVILFLCSLLGMTSLLIKSRRKKK